MHTVDITEEREKEIENQITQSDSSVLNSNEI